MLFYEKKSLLFCRLRKEYIMPIYENLPKDPVMLLSFTNTKLRDSFQSLDSFCENFGLDRGELEAKLGSIQYKYDEETNQFI